MRFKKKIKVLVKTSEQTNLQKTLVKCFTASGSSTSRRLQHHRVSLQLTPPPTSLQVNFFDEYQMEGVSSEANEICLEVTPENLSRALKTVQNAKTVKVKLTKKHCPCLTIAAELVRERRPLSPSWLSESL